MAQEQNDKIRAQMHEILDIVLDGNGFEKRARQETGTLPTLFLRYSGHVNWMEIDLHIDGWESGRGYDRNWVFQLGEISQATIDDIRAAVTHALENKTETDVLRRDILRQEGKIKDEKDTLAQLRKTLRRKERKEKAAVGAAT